MSYINTNTRPVWSADGNRLAAELGTRAVVIDRQTSSVTELGREGRWTTSPTFDPEEDKVVFASYDYIGDAELPGWGIYATDLESGETEVLAERCNRPTYSPNGEEIAMVGYYGRRMANRLTLMHEDGSAKAPVVDPGTLQTEFSFDSDGDRIAYQTYGDVKPEIRVLEKSWGKETVVTDGQNGNYWDRSPQWSPDDQKILFERHDRDLDKAPTVGLWTVNLDSGEEKQIPLPKARHLDATWSPDGSKIAFISNMDGGDWYDLYVMDADGSNLKCLKDALGDQHAPSWSPDGKTLAYLTFDWNKPKEHQRTLHLMDMEPPAGQESSS